MKKLLVILLFFVSHLGFCQNSIWDDAPEQVIAIFNQGDGKLISQYVDGNQLWMGFESEKYKGITTTYHFFSDKLKDIYFEYDLSIFVPPTPLGKKTVLRSGKTCWINYENKTITMRKYRTGKTIDIMLQLKQ